MKTIYSAALVLLIAISFSAKKVIFQENKLVATFKGITEDDLFKFVDDKNKEHLFYDIDDEIEIDLYDDTFIGKKFTLTWKNQEIEDLDEEGEETGKVITVKIITSLKQS
ncbi:MAG: hypothetical protein ACKVIG_00795 [Flavobacteriales bacterium]